jgi:hypothetical protein
MRGEKWGTRNALGSWQSGAYSSEVFVSSFGKNELLGLDGNLLHTILQKTFPVLWRTNSWAYWLVLCCDLEEEAVEQITNGILSTLSLDYSTDCGCEQIYVCIYLSIILSSTLQILLSPPELQSAFVRSFEC